MSHDNTHVTTIIREAGLVSLDWVKQEHLDRGIAVHTAIHYYNEEDLDMGSLDGTVAKRLGQYIEFIAVTRPQIICCEMDVGHPSLGYVGRLDILAREFDGYPTVFDIKNGQPDPWHGVQLAAYVLALESEDWMMKQVGKRPKRFGLYLTDTSWRLVQYKDRQDYAVFKAALTIRNWKENQKS